MSEVIEFIQNSVSVFDLIVCLVIIYSMARCAAKGFMMSLLSFSKWLLALVITIILVPKLNPWVQDYIESKFITDIGLGIFIYITSLFVVINIGKAINRAFTYTGLGSVDKSFGLVFGIFKGYVFIVCIFSIVNWFYSYEKWDMSLKNSYFFSITEKGSKLLIEEFPERKDLEDTKKEIENI